MDKVAGAEISQMEAWSDPIGAELTIDGQPADKAALAAALQAGEMQGIRFGAVVFRAEYPNANFVRFRDEDMPAFARSFGGQPFLRNHDTHDIGSRDGTIHSGRFEGGAVVEEVDLTTERGMKSFIEGQIDRFSIGWFFEGLTCSVCGNDWRNYDMCPHWPGQQYHDDDDAEHLCEIIFEGPSGKETSAVNVPAVSGTGILAALQEARAAGITSKEEFFEMAEETGIKKEEDAVAEATPKLEETAAPQAGAPSTGWEDVLRDAGTDALLNASGLSAPARDLVRSSLGDSFEPDDVTAGIERVRAVLAKERDANVVQGIHPITAGDMQDGLDRFKLDFDWVMGVPDVRMPDPRSRSLRDQYLALTGDYGFHGKFDPEQAQLANANSSTFAGVVLDAMNRIVEHHYQNEMMYRWFEQFVDVTPHDGSTHPIKMITVDGIANLPIVTEGGSYTEAVVGDAKEEMAFSKRGSYVGITIETLMQNNIVRARSIPANLVISSIRTRSAAIGYLFTQASGVGPTLAQDTKALFHADHGNLSTAAFADASWRAMRSQMFKQTVPGTGKPFATWPRYCLVPVDLYDRALVQFGYGSGDVGKPNGAGTSQEVNPYGEARPGDPRPIPIAVPEFTDTNDWAAVVEMSMFAPIKMAYAMSPGGGMHPLVELYEAESPNGGLMFTNDTLPIKARDWWAYGVSSHIGVAKANV